MNMNTNRIHILILSVLLSLTIVGCSSDNEEYSDTNINPVKDAVGIYVGDGGGLFTLMEDGNADYFEAPYFCPDRSRKWTYADNVLRVKLNDKYDTYAEAEDLSAKEYFFKGDSTDVWIDETYTKITDDAYHMTRDESMAVLRENIPTLYPEEAPAIIEKLDANVITYSDYNFGGLIFKIPSMFEEIKPYTYGSNDGMAGIYFNTYTRGCVAEEAFERSIKALNNECEEKGLSFITDLNRYYDKPGTVATVQCSEMYYTGMFEGIEAEVRTALINNIPNKTLVRFVFNYPKSFTDYDEVYDQLLNSIEITSSEQLSQTQTNNAKTDIAYTTPAQSFSTSDTTTLTNKTSRESAKRTLYATTKVKIRKEPNINSEEIGMLEKGDKVETHDRNKVDWTLIKSGRKEGYVKSEYLSETAVMADKNETSGEKPFTKESWKDELPFKYDDEYTGSQNVYMYMEKNSLTPEEVEHLIYWIPGLSGTVEWKYYEDVASFDDNHYSNTVKVVNISDTSGKIECQMEKRGEGWITRELSYIVPGSHGLVIRGGSKEFYLEDFEHPLTYTIHERPTFKTFKEAISYVKSH